MKKQCLIILAHPDKDSLAFQNMEVIQKSAKAKNFEVTLVNAFDFPIIPKDPIPHGVPNAFDEISEILPKADRIFVVGPMWNFSFPGALKNFLDGAMQAKKSFQFVPVGWLKKIVTTFGLGKILPTAFPKGLMKASCVDLVWTCDGPAWYYQIFRQKNEVFRQCKNIFSYGGVRKTRQYILGMTYKRSPEEIQKWFQKISTIL